MQSELLSPLGEGAVCELVELRGSQPADVIARRLTKVGLELLLLAELRRFAFACEPT